MKKPNNFLKEMLDVSFSLSQSTLRMIKNFNIHAIPGNTQLEKLNTLNAFLSLKSPIKFSIGDNNQGIKLEEIDKNEYDALLNYNETTELDDCEITHVQRIFNISFKNSFIATKIIIYNEYDLFANEISEDIPDEIRIEVKYSNEYVNEFYSPILIINALNIGAIINIEETVGTSILSETKKKN